MVIVFYAGFTHGQQPSIHSDLDENQEPNHGRIPTHLGWQSADGYTYPEDYEPGFGPWIERGLRGIKSGWPQDDHIAKRGYSYQNDGISDYEDPEDHEDSAAQIPDDNNYMEHATESPAGNFRTPKLDKSDFDFDNLSYHEIIQFSNDISESNWKAFLDSLSYEETHGPWSSTSKG